MDTKEGQEGASCKIPSLECARMAFLEGNCVDRFNWINMCIEKRWKSFEVMDVPWKPGPVLLDIAAIQEKKCQSEQIEDNTG